MGTKISGTREWAETNLNFQKGCRNNCVYCYAKSSAIRFGTATPESWAEPTISMPKHFPKGKQIMFPSSHDLDTKNLSEALECLGKLLANGNRVLIVTKPRGAVIRKLIDFLSTPPYSAYRDNVTFRLTIGTTNEKILKAFEPGAPDFVERFMALRDLKIAKLKAGVSAEPLLGGVDTFTYLYDKVRPFLTDDIWVGKMNYPRQRIHQNSGGDFPEELIDWIISQQKDEEMLCLYEKYRNCSDVRFKDSIINSLHCNI